jgi:hypothetical protein
MNFRVEPAIVRFWVKRRLPLEAKLVRLMPTLSLNVAPWIIFGNGAKCRRSVPYYCSAASSNRSSP